MAPCARPSPLSTLLALVLFTALVAAAPVAAQEEPAPDRIGIYWDTAYTVNGIHDVAVPTTVTGYLVLRNPTRTEGGLGGFECRVETVGDPLLQFNLVGSAVNYDTPPDFVVAYTQPLPVTGLDVLLATVDVHVADLTPTALELVPKQWAPSLPGAMSYIPWDDKEALTPMTTVTGTPFVAGINWVPMCDLSPASIAFPEIAVGTSLTRTVTLTNTGGGVLEASPWIDGSSTFSLDPDPGWVSVPSGESRTLTVRYAPVDGPGIHNASLMVGGDCAPVALWGQARDPIVEVTPQPAMLDFGSVVVGQSSVANVRLTNTGETAATVEPAIAGCPAFTTNAPPATLEVGESVIVGVTFTPTEAGVQSCALSLGPDLGQVALVGTGVAPFVELTANPAAVNFGTVEAGSVLSRDVAIANTGNVPAQLTPQAFPAGSPFLCANPAPGQTATVQPGASLTMQVLFAPEEAGAFYGDLTFVEHDLTVALGGTGSLDPGDVYVSPQVLDFGAMVVDAYATLSTTVINASIEPVELVPALDPSSHFTLQTSGPLVLQPGEDAAVSVRCQPAAAGFHVTTLHLGPGLPDVSCRVNAVEPTLSVTVEPPTLAFGVWPVGADTQLEVRVINQGAVAVDMDPFLNPDGPPFQLTAGASLGVVPPYSTATLRVRFFPTLPGTWVTTLHLGPGLDPVPVSGIADADAPACALDPDALVFPPTPVGGGTPRTVTVTNVGPTDLELAPSTNCGAFRVLGGAATVTPGTSEVVTVVFEPADDVNYACVLDLGDDVCATVPLSGTGFDGLPVGTEADLVGLYFDQNLTLPWALETQPLVPFEGYLVFHNPSVPQDLTGWELRVDTEEEVSLLGATYTGGGVNYSTLPQFTVGLMSPLPAQQTMVLATFTFVTSTGVESSPISLLPKYLPSIPDNMACISGPTHELRPIFTVTGVPTVAWVSRHGPSVATVPGPEVSLAGGEAVVTWQMPVDATAGAHVWRRDPDGRERRLTATPVVGRGRTTWRDDVSGLDAGGRVGYAFAVLDGTGAERYRSPLTEVTLPEAATYATRLLPNVPNPFNPETTIRFELARDARVRIDVFDVMGRRVARLLDEARAAGPGRVVWRGRDDRGRVVSSGAYYVRLESDDRTDTRKVMLLK